jgi:putative SOS response-associated peptidase YedK
LSAYVAEATLPHTVAFSPMCCAASSGLRLAAWAAMTQTMSTVEAMNARIEHMSVSQSKFTSTGPSQAQAIPKQGTGRPNGLSADHRSEGCLSLRLPIPVAFSFRAGYVTTIHAASAPLKKQRVRSMSNLYSLTKGQAAIMGLTRAMRDITGTMPLLPAIFPDFSAPIVRTALDGVRELALARWGMPSSERALLYAAKRRAQKFRAKGRLVDFNALLRSEPDGGRTNIRHPSKGRHWKQWLGPEHRCLVPFSSFSEFNKAAGGDIWFALDESRPLAVFAAIWTNRTSVRKAKEGETTNDLFGLLTTVPNVEVGVHHRAMPVMLTTPEEIELWMTAPTEKALKLQRPLPNGALKVVAIGGRKDAVADHRVEPTTAPLQ